MASEEHEETSVSVSLSPDLSEWLETQADRHGQPRDEFLASLVAAHRTAVSEVEDGDLPEAVERRFEEQHDEFTDLLNDVRKRVVQLKRATDAKAPQDHEHEELASRLADLDDSLEEIESELDDLDSSVAAFERRVEDGFDNYEEVLDHLADRTSRLSDRLDVLARAVLDTRDELRRLSTQEASRAEAEQLQLAANQLGIRSANCGECGESVEIGLLTEPKCPHCASTFADVKSKEGFFGSHTLETGDTPALEGAVGEPELDADLDDLVDEGTEPSTDEDDEETT